MGSHLIPLNPSLRPPLASPWGHLSITGSSYLLSSHCGLLGMDFNMEEYKKMAKEKLREAKQALLLAEVFKKMEEIKKVAEEKLREAEQEVASQTVDKVFDAVEEATLGDSNFETVKRKYIARERGAGYRRRGGSRAPGN